MKKEEKQLLIKDLCARLPYGVICYAADNEYGESGMLYSVDPFEKTDPNIYIQYRKGNVLSFFTSEVKPYLRLMSSMAEEELNECVCQSGIKDIECPNWQNIPKEKQFEARLNHAIAVFLTDSNNVDWLNAHHFDYRGLIEKGLALEAPEGMYNI